MRRSLRRSLSAVALIVAASLSLATVASGEARLAQPGQTGIVPAAPAVINDGFECSDGFRAQAGISGLVPDGWTAVPLQGSPKLNSTRIEFAGSCEGSGFIERIAGIDSLAVLSEDIETPPEPGKPFDVALYQQVSVTPGIAYSASAWMVSLCGGSAMPNDCPANYFIGKSLGMDPSGGTDPGSPSVNWTEDLRNFTESRWANLRLGTVATGSTLTLFVRIRSPFRWHGAHAFVDAVSLVTAPQADFVGLSGAKVAFPGTEGLVRWTGSLGADIASIPDGTHRLLYDVQYRQGPDSPWVEWVSGESGNSATLTVDGCQSALSYTLRVRARAEQPEGSTGAWPNHRFPGSWRESGPLTFATTTSCLPRAFLPWSGRSLTLE